MVSRSHIKPPGRGNHRGVVLGVMSASLPLCGQELTVLGRGMAHEHVSLGSLLHVVASLG